MKDFIINDKLQWKTDIETTLNRFPIMLRSNEWMKGTDFHHHPGLEIHMTQEGAGTMVVGRQILMQSSRSVLVFRGMVPHQMISRSSYKRSVICIKFGDDDTGLLPSLHRLIDFAWIPEDSCLSFSLNPKQFQHMEEMYKLLRHELDTREIGWERVALAQVLQITVFLQRSSTDPERVTTLSPQPSGRKNDLVQLCLPPEDAWKYQLKEK